MQAWKEQHPQARFSEMEEQVLKVRKRFGEEMMRELLEGRAEAHPVPGPRCPDCRKEMHYKGEKKLRQQNGLDKGAKRSRVAAS